MNSEVIGKFIQGERKKLNITQEKLYLNGKMEKVCLALIISFY